VSHLGHEGAVAGQCLVVLDELRVALVDMMEGLIHVAVDALDLRHVSLLVASVCVSVCVCMCVCVRVCVCVCVCV